MTAAGCGALVAAAAAAAAASEARQRQRRRPLPSAPAGPSLTPLHAIMQGGVVAGTLRDGRRPASPLALALALVASSKRGRLACLPAVAAAALDADQMVRLPRGWWRWRGRPCCSTPCAS